MERDIQAIPELFLDGGTIPPHITQSGVFRVQAGR